MAISKIPSAGISNAVNFRNILINGDMSVDQRNETATINAGSPTYNVDRFLGRGASSAGVFTLEQDTDSPDDFTNSLKATVTTADSSVDSGASYRLQQVVEGVNTSQLNWGTSSAKTVTLSFYVKSSVAGTFGGSLANGDYNRFNVFSYAINSADTWERKTVTITGDTSGTWATNTGLGIRVNWSLGAGSTYVGSAGSWGSSAKEGVTGQTNLIETNSATFRITGTQLEIGNQASSFEHLPIDVNLRRCQRYYYALLNTGENNKYFVSGYQYTSSYIYCFTEFPTEMRAAPTLVQGSGSNYYTFYSNSSGDEFNDFDQSITMRKNNATFGNNSEISGTAGHAGRVYSTNTNSYVHFNAEL